MIPSIILTSGNTMVQNFLIMPMLNSIYIRLYSAIASALESTPVEDSRRENVLSVLDLVTSNLPKRLADHLDDFFDNKQLFLTSPLISLM